MPTEESPLIVDAGVVSDNVDPISYDGMASGVHSNGETDSIEVDTELDQPWPATFARSMSLIARPTMDTSFVKRMIRSPKITPRQVLRRRNQAKNLQRGYATPDPPQREISPENEFRKGLAKIQSLDFYSNANNQRSISEETEMDQSRRSLEAHAYRHKLLQQAANEKAGTKIGDSNIDKDGGDLHSPGYDREIQPEINLNKVDSHGAVTVDNTSTFGQSLFNMINSLMGVGMLGTPFICSRTGWIGGLFITSSFCLIAWRTSIMLGRELNGDPRPVSMFYNISNKSTDSNPLTRMCRPITSFPEIARAAFGQKINIILSSILYFELFSCLCIFFVSSGDHLDTLFPSVSKKRLMTYFAFLLLVPTTLLRTPRLLSYLSAVGIAASITVVLSVLAAAFYFGSIAEEFSESSHLSNTTGSYHTLWDSSGIPIGYGLIAFTFSGHALVPSIYSSMERPQDFEKMTTLSFMICVTCCITIAVSGYYTFGSAVDDQITVSLEKASGGGNSAISAVTWLMILTAFSKYTLSCFPIALGLEELFVPCMRSEKMMELVSTMVKLILLTSSLLVAMFVPSFSFLCSLVGLLCTMVVSVIFPAAAHLKMFGTKLPWYEKIIDWTLIIFGIVFAVAGTSAVLNDA